MSVNSSFKCENGGCAAIYEDKCYECSLAFCTAHFYNHNCGSHPRGSSSSSVQHHLFASPPPSRSFATPSRLQVEQSRTVENVLNSQQGSAPAKRRKVTQPVIETNAPRLKWGPEEVIRDAGRHKLEEYDGKSWLWAHFRRFSKLDSAKSDQSYEASCNICHEEAKINSCIKWVVFYDKSTTKLNRHLELCHRSVCLDHSKESAKILLSSGDRTMTEYLCVGANDDYLYRFLKMCVKMCLPISMCEHEFFKCKWMFLVSICVCSFPITLFDIRYFF